MSESQSSHIVAVIVAGYLGPNWYLGPNCSNWFYKFKVQIVTWVLLNICSAWKTFPPHLSQIMYVIKFWMVLLKIWWKIVEIKDKMMMEEVPWASWTALLSGDDGSVYELWSCWHRLNTVTIVQCLWWWISLLRYLFMMHTMATCKISLC